MTIDPSKFDKNKVFNHMITDHYTRFIGSIVHLFALWIAVLLIFGAPFAAFTLVFWTGFHIGRGDQRLEILNAEFAEYTSSHKIGLIFIQLAAIVCLFVYCRSEWLGGFSWGY